MQLRILQLNVNGLMWKENLRQYLENRSYDILNFQETVGKDTKVGNIDSSDDSVEELQKMLGPNFHPYIAKNNIVTSSPTAYFGMATFVKADLPVIRHENIFLHKRTTPFPSDSQAFDEKARSVLAIQIATDTTPIWILQTHFIWSPTPEDTPRKLAAGKILLDFISTLKTPFIFTGDMNVDNNSQVIKSLEKYGHNLIKEYHITNTLDPKNHKLFEKIPQGLAVDYIFVGPKITVKEFKLTPEGLSDHLGLEVTVEI